MTKFTNKNKFKKLDLRERGIIYLLKTNIKTKRKFNKLDFKKLRSFKTKKQLRLMTFQLKLLKEIKIYLIFYTTLLKLALKKTPVIKK
jgi:hypothetical protein